MHGIYALYIVFSVVVNTLSFPKHCFQFLSGNDCTSHFQELGVPFSVICSNIAYKDIEPSYACEILRELIARIVTKISSCQGNTSSRRGIKQLEISFFSIFLLFSYESSQGPRS